MKPQNNIDTILTRKRISRYQFEFLYIENKITQSS